jgi:hypothetical protein
MTTKHTAGEWYTRHGQISSLTSAHGCTIANCNRTANGISDEEADANAAYIVAACNSHAGLVEALRDVLRFFDHQGDVRPYTWQERKPSLAAARAAREKAGATT